jgi:hypothetical protein
LHGLKASPVADVLELNGKPGGLIVVHSLVDN